MQDAAGTVGVRLAPFNPSHDEVVAIALGLMSLQPSDVLYDLGCGDGRVLVKACQENPLLKATGVEYDRSVYDRAVQLVAASQLSEQITIIHGNVLDVEFGDATSIFVYLLPEGMKQLRDRFCSVLAKGGRIVSYGKRLNFLHCCSISFSSLRRCAILTSTYCLM